MRWLAASLLLLLVPVANAQQAAFTAATTFVGGELGITGPYEVPFTATLDCVTVLSTGGGTATAQAKGLPAWLNATAGTATFSPADCAASPTGSLTAAGTVKLTPAANAPGLTPVKATLDVTYQGAAGDPQAASVEVPQFMVGYRAGHKLTPDGDQSFKVPGSGAFTFDMTIEVLANARTMVMFEDKIVSDPDALVNGLKAHTYEVPKGETREVRKVTFTPPQGAWDQVTVTFRTYSHCLDGKKCDPQQEETHKWTFVNDAPATAAATTSKSASAPAMAILFMALAACALARRR